MIEDDTQNSRHAASAAFHNAPRLTKIAQAGMQGGPTGAAAGSGAAHAARRDFRHADTAQHGNQ